MSVVKTYDVFCDLDDCTEWCTEATTTQSAAAARKTAQQHGWKRRLGRDFCPRCSATLDKLIESHQRKNP